MIAGFADKVPEAVWLGEGSRRLPGEIQQKARLKLRLIHAAVRLDDLRALPGNRLEALAGDRRGQHSIRINEQWRICFRWIEGEAYDVAIVDYH